VRSAGATVMDGGEGERERVQMAPFEAMEKGHFAEVSVINVNGILTPYLASIRWSW